MNALLLPIAAGWLAVALWLMGRVPKRAWLRLTLTQAVVDAMKANSGRLREAVNAQNAMWARFAGEQMANAAQSNAANVTEQQYGQFAVRWREDGGQPLRWSAGTPFDEGAPGR